MTRRQRARERNARRGTLRTTVLVAALPLVFAGRAYARDHPAPTRTTWKIDTHIYAANIALADALDDGNVSIPPFGEFPVPADVLRALQRYPSDFRAGVAGPDLFPDFWVGAAISHVDQSPEGRWTSDGWLRHLFATARQWPDATTRDRVTAFVYGYLTHAAGDMFGHSYVNHHAGGAWDFSKPPTWINHVVLEGYISKHTPPTDHSIAVWNRFVADALITHPAIAANAPDATHYRYFVRLHDRVGRALRVARDSMKVGAANSTYAVQCTRNPIWCARKEYLETWHRDIEEGLRALVQANRVLGEHMLRDDMLGGVGALQDWTTAWLPKMFGAHVAGEVMTWLATFDPLAVLTEPVKREIRDFLVEQFAAQIAMAKLMTDPSSYMPQRFSAAQRARIVGEMAMGPDSLLRWRDFAMLYNTVILTKLVFLDGTGLNALAGRAGISQPLFEPGPATNVMLRVVKSMDGDRAWEGGPYGYSYVPYPGPQRSRKAIANAGPTLASASQPIRMPTGFALYLDTESRTKIFGRIFKGFPETGPGPESGTRADTPRIVRPADRTTRPIRPAIPQTRTRPRL